MTSLSRFSKGVRDFRNRTGPRLNLLSDLDPHQSNHNSTLVMSVIAVSTRSKNFHTTPTILKILVYTNHFALLVDAARILQIQGLSAGRPGVIAVSSRPIPTIMHTTRLAHARYHRCRCRTPFAGFETDIFRIFRPPELPCDANWYVLMLDFADLGAFQASIQ
jgi:hypothetical protein